jgi:hypothetical protein
MSEQGDHVVHPHERGLSDPHDTFVPNVPLVLEDLTPRWIVKG